jgi:hypothetical protein
LLSAIIGDGASAFFRAKADAGTASWCHPWNAGAGVFLDRNVQRRIGQQIAMASKADVVTTAGSSHSDA